LFSDTFLHLAPLGEAVIPLEEHRRGAEYSHQIMDLVPASLVASLPFPRLALFFEVFAGNSVIAEMTCLQLLQNSWWMG
jgi:hypothetical protein